MFTGARVSGATLAPPRAVAMVKEAKLGRWVRPLPVQNQKALVSVAAAVGVITRRQTAAAVCRYREAGRALIVCRSSRGCLSLTRWTKVAAVASQCGRGSHLPPAAEQERVDQGFCEASFREISCESFENGR